MKRVSVVILNWNGVDMLRKFIPSVMDNSVGEGIEICVEYYKKRSCVRTVADT